MIIDNTTHAIERIVTFIDCELPQDAWPHWHDGWAQESEAALIDSIFSARAAYGSPTTGVRAVIERWRTYRQSATPLNNLRALAAFSERGDELATILGNRQRVPGNYSTKAEAVALAATALVETKCVCSTDINNTQAHREAVVSVPGLGERTFELLLFLCGTLTPDSIDLLTHFVIEAGGTGEPLGDAEMTELLTAVAGQLDVPATTLAHAAWRYQRTIEQPRRPAKSA